MSSEEERKNTGRKVFAPGKVETFMIASIALAIVTYCGFDYVLKIWAAQEKNRQIYIACDQAGGVIAWGRCMRKDLFIDVSRK